MVDILFISGSPRKNNNEKAITRMMEIAKQEGFKFLDQINLSDYEAKPCLACNACAKTKECIAPEVNEINKKLEKTRAIIITSPVYFGSMTAQLKALLDRTRPLRKDFRLKDKIGAAITTGASRNGGQELTIQSIHSWMHIQGMIVVGDNSHFGGTLTCPVMEDDVGLATMENTVKKVCSTLKRLS